MLAATAKHEKKVLVAEEADGWSHACLPKALCSVIELHSVFEGVHLLRALELNKDSDELYPCMSTQDVSWDIRKGFRARPTGRWICQGDEPTTRVVAV